MVRHLFFRRSFHTKSRCWLVVSLRKSENNLTFCLATRYEMAVTWRQPCIVYVGMAGLSTDRSKSSNKQNNNRPKNIQITFRKENSPSRKGGGSRGISIQFIHLQKSKQKIVKSKPPTISPFTTKLSLKKKRCDCLLLVGVILAPFLESTMKSSCARDTNFVGVLC